MCHISFFLSKFEFQSISVTLKMRSRSLKSSHFFPSPQWSIYASLNQTNDSWDRIHTRVIFRDSIMQRPCKRGQDHRNVITSFPYPNYISVLVCTQTFYKAHFWSLCNVVTLKMRSRSQKSIHFFPIMQPPSWMRRPTGDQEVTGSTPAEVGNILSWRLIMKYFLRSFSPFRWFKKGSCQFLAKECAQYWLTA